MNDISDSAIIDIHQCGRSRSYNLRQDSFLMSKNMMPPFGFSHTEIDFLRVCSQNFKAQNLKEEVVKLKEQNFTLMTILAALVVLLMVIAPFYYYKRKTSS